MVVCKPSTKGGDGGVQRAADFARKIQYILAAHIVFKAINRS